MMLQRMETSGISHYMGQMELITVGSSQLNRSNPQKLPGKPTMQCDTEYERTHKNKFGPAYLTSPPREKI